MDLIVKTESESERVHQRSSSAKQNKPRISFLHVEKCRVPSEDDQPRRRSIVENCENEHRSYQINYLEYQHHFAMTRSTKSVCNLIILTDTSNIRDDSSDQPSLNAKSIRLVIITQRRRQIPETRANQPSIDLNINS